VPDRQGFFDWKLILTREVLGVITALFFTMLLIGLCYDGMRISGIWSGL